jgi:hypothetical protein
MVCFARFVRLAIGAVAFLLLVSATSPSIAQEVDPNASAVKEQQLLQQLERIQGRVSIPDQQLPELSLHNWRRIDLPDVDRRQHPEQGGCRLAQARRGYGRP